MRIQDIRVYQAYRAANNLPHRRIYNPTSEAVELFNCHDEGLEPLYVLRKRVSRQSCPANLNTFFIHPQVPGVEVYVGLNYGDYVNIISRNAVNPDNYPNAVRYNNRGQEEF